MFVVLIILRVIGRIQDIQQNFGYFLWTRPNDTILIGNFLKKKRKISKDLRQNIFLKSILSDLCFPIVYKLNHYIHVLKVYIGLIMEFDGFILWRVLHIIH